MKEHDSSVSGLDMKLGQTSSQCMVVMYHYVHDLGSIPGKNISSATNRIPGLSPKEFSEQIDELCSTMEPIDWPTLYGSMNGRSDLPPRSFLLTFDDGLADHAKIVLPILEEYNIRGVFFVPAAVLTHYQMLSSHATHLLLATLGTEPLYECIREQLSELSEKKWVEDFVRGVDSPDEATSRMYHYESPIRAHIKYFLTMKMPVSLRQSVINSLFVKHVGSMSRWAKRWYLGWDDLVDIHALGHTIGGHSFAHEPLSHLTPDGCIKDLLRSAEVLNDGLGHDIRPMSYPYGCIPDDAPRMCKQAGFVHAFTTERRYLGKQDDPYLLPRVDTIQVKQLLSESIECNQA